MPDPIELDASSFQKPLGQLAEVLSQKVRREAHKLIGLPEFVTFDLHVLIRQAQHTYDLLFYLNADDRRETDSYWRPAYTVVVLPLIRNMIDCLYNITAILQDPWKNGLWFRKSGYKKLLEGLDQDQARYGGDPEWDAWIQNARSEIEFDIRHHMPFTVDAVLAEKEWPTLGKYVNMQQTGGTYSCHQMFLKTLLYGQWREYSAMAHGGSDGLLKTDVFFIQDALTHEQRPDDDKFLRMFSMHIGQAAGVLLSIVTELQAHFQFDGADINIRIHKMWDVLMPTFAVKELYKSDISSSWKTREFGGMTGAPQVGACFRAITWESLLGGAAVHRCVHTATNPDGFSR
jgi:hypothetical protein